MAGTRTSAAAARIGAGGSPRGSNKLFAALAPAAMGVGSLHALAPDHWVPFAALSRARGWSGGRTLRVTLLCGFGHVTVSALLGLLGLLFGVVAEFKKKEKKEAEPGQ